MGKQNLYFHKICQKKISFLKNLPHTARRQAKSEQMKSQKLNFEIISPQLWKKNTSAAGAANLRWNFHFFFIHTQIEFCEKQKSNACFWLFLSVSYCNFCSSDFFCCCLMSLLSSFLEVASSGAYGHVVFDVSETDADINIFHISLFQHIKSFYVLNSSNITRTFQRFF